MVKMRVRVEPYLLLQRELGILITRSSTLNILLELRDPCLLLLVLAVVAALFLDEAVEGGCRDGELAWWRHDGLLCPGCYEIRVA